MLGEDGDRFKGIINIFYFIENGLKYYKRIFDMIIL